MEEIDDLIRQAHEMVLEMLRTDSADLLPQLEADLRAFLEPGKQTVTVMLACYDNHGHFSGQIARIVFSPHVNSGSPLIDLEGEPSGFSFLSPAQSEFAPARRITRIQVGRQFFKIEKYGNWTGYWAWDMVEMHVDDASHLLNYLYAILGWRPTEGLIELWEALEAEEYVNLADYLNDEEEE
jgi:hypothetical protein